MTIPISIPYIGHGRTLFGIYEVLHEGDLQVVGIDSKERLKQILLLGVRDLDV